MTRSLYTSYASQDIFGKIVPPNLPPNISDHPDKTSEKFRNFEELYLRKLSTNYSQTFAIVLILRRSLQWYRRIFPILHMSKVEKNRGKAYWFQRPFWCCSTTRDLLCVMGPLGPSRIFQRMTWKNLVYSLTVSLSKSPTLLMNTTVSCCCQNLCSSCCLVLLTLLHYVIWSSHESETLKTLPKKTPVQILHNRFSSVRVLSCV